MAKEIGSKSYEMGDTIWAHLKQDRLNLYDNESEELIIRAV